MQVLVFSDLHSHPHRAFATYEGGVNSRLTDVLRVLDQVKELAKSCDLVLFGGDLFHAAPPSSFAFNVVYDRVGEIASETPVAMIAGNHDLRTKYFRGERNEIPFLKFQDLVGVTLLEVDFPEVMTFSSRGGSESVTVYGVNHRRLEDTREVLKEAPVADICLIHQDVLGASVGRFVFPAGIEHEETAKFTWTFCGHIHQPQRIGDRFVVTGAPLHINFADSGERGVWVLDTKQQTVIMFSTKFPKFITVGSEQEVKEDGDFYRVEEVKEKQTEALKLPGFEESVTEYVREAKASEEIGKVGLSLMSQVPKEVVTPSDFTIDEVHVENFTVFEEASFSAEAGLYLVVGEFEGQEGKSNGSGKTSLFEAIAWALYGLTSKGERGSAVMRRELGRGGKCLVEVVLHSPTRGTMTVTRTQSKSGSALVVKLGEHVQEGDVRITQKWLVDTLGVSYEFFRQMVYFSQESVDFFSAMGDADQKRILGTLLGLTYYDDAHQLAKQKRNVAADLSIEALQKIETTSRLIEQVELQIERMQVQVEAWEKERVTTVRSAEGRIAETEKARGSNRSESAERRVAVNSQAGEAICVRAVELEAQILSLEGNAKFRREALEKTLCEKRTHAEEQVQKVREGLESLPSLSDLQENLAVEKEELTTAQKIFADASTVCAQGKAYASSLQDQVDGLERKIAEILSLGAGKCPTCGADVTPESKARCAREVRGAVEGLVVSLAEQQKKADEASLLMKAAQGGIDEYQVKIRGTEQGLERRRELEGSLAEAERTLESLVKEQEQAVETWEREVESQRGAIHVDHQRSLDKIREEQRIDLVKVDAEEAAREESLMRLIEEETEWLKGVQEKVNPFQKSLEDLGESLGIHRKRVVEVEAQHREAHKSAELFEFWVKGFGREGIPAALLQGFCRFFTVEVNEILSQMHIGVSVELSASTTLKSGEVRDRLDYVIRTRTGESTYRMLSGGEKVRVDLTSMLVLNLLASRRFGIKNGLFGVLILDEVLSSLDEQGCETVYEILSRFQSRTIFIISHSFELKALFNKVITVRRTNDVSVVV